MRVPEGFRPKCESGGQGWNVGPAAYAEDIESNTGERVIEPSKDTQPTKRSSAAGRRAGDVKKVPVARKARTRVWRLGDTDGGAPQEQPSAASDGPPRKRAPLREINSELAELAAKKQLHPENHQRLKQILNELEQILNEAARLASTRPESRRLYERALQSQQKALKLAARKKRQNWAPGPAGMVQNPGLSQGGREVLGGLPSSRRGH